MTPAPRERPDDEGAQIVPFPGMPLRPEGQPSGEVELAPEVHDAELVDEEEYQRRRTLPTVRVAAQRVAGAATSPRATGAAKVTLRAGVTIGQGFGSWARRAYDGATLGVYRRQIRAAEAAGDREQLADWTTRAEQARTARHQRLKELPKVAAGLAVVAAIAAATLVVGALLVATLVHVTGAGTFLGTLEGILTAAVITATVATVVAPAAILAAAWREGRRRAEPPAWLAAPATGGDVMDALPDEGTIVKALANCNIPGFTKALKGGWRVRFRMPPTIDGKGWQCQIDLPPAAPVEEFVKRKPMLAHNLLRYPIEVWPTEPSPGVLDLWVAKSGALSGPVDPWPLLDDLDNATTDYFAGVPVAVTIKGDVVRGRLFEANYVFGGMMGSGKSTMAINLVLGAMLDPLVDIDIVVMAENADYEPMKPRLRSLVTGAGKETVELCLAMLHELYGEVSTRGKALREHDARASSRNLAQADERLRPRLVVVDECQNLFIGEFGKDALEVAVKLQSTARKYGITLIWLTPEPSKDALPRKLISITSNKACFAIGDQQGNDAVLGTGSYKAGISAVGLTPKTDEGPGDVGTCMARGFTAKPGLLRSFYIPQDDAHRVTQRALQLRAGAGDTATAEPVRRDLLDDLTEVLGTEPVPIADVPALLSRLAPRWVPYRGLTGKALRDQLAELGVKVASTGNRWPLDPAAVREALARRATADLDGE